jgi:hypothetical protein
MLAGLMPRTCLKAVLRARHRRPDGEPGSEDGDEQQIEHAVEYRVLTGLVAFGLLGQVGAE